MARSSNSYCNGHRLRVSILNLFDKIDKSNQTYFCSECTSLSEKATPFNRKIHPDEIWLYRNPRTDSYVPVQVLWPFVFGVPCTIFLIHFLMTRNKLEFIQANLALSLAFGFNGIITNVLKLCVGNSSLDISLLSVASSIHFILFKC